MVGEWPEASDDLKPYDPNQIIGDAHQFAMDYPKETAPELLGSMRDMIERSIVSPEQRPKVLEATCSVWRANPEEAIETLSEGYCDLDPGSAAGLLASVDWTKEKHPNLLKEAWSSVVKAQGGSARIDTTRSILEMGTTGPNDEPDQGLRMWIDALGESGDDVISTVLTQANLNDVHRKRLWHQAMRLSADLGPEFFLQVIPNVLVLSNAHETASAVFGDRAEVSVILRSRDLKAQLSNSLMEIFTQAPTKSIKGEIASWCKDLNGQASLRQLNSESLSEDEITILRSKFPGSKAVKSIEKEREKKVTEAGR